MEHDWGYVQERINLVEGINQEINQKSKKLPIKNPYSITPPGVVIPGSEIINQLPIQITRNDDKNNTLSGEDISKFMMNPNMCNGGICSIDNKPDKHIDKPIKSIMWINGNNQVSFITNNQVSLN